MRSNTNNEHKIEMMPLEVVDIVKAKQRTLQQPITTVRQLSFQEHNLNVALLETTDMLVVILDRDGRIVLFNRACEYVTGFTANEVIRHMYLASLDSSRTGFSRPARVS